jgi:two-component system, NtrC family, nitrogen regulation response regulator NtrX
LIVDDEAPLRRQVMVGLAQHGYEVDECEEGLSALSKIRAAESIQNPFGCVILDICLPDIDGLKILSVIKAIYSDLPVVVITGYGNEDTIDTVQSHGAPHNCFSIALSCSMSMLSMVCRCPTWH